MMLPAFLILVAVTILLTWSTQRSRARFLRRLQAEWGRPRKRARDIDGISDLFRSRGAIDTALDDRTWNDLLLDDVFAYLDRTESSVGQQVLYDRLRSAPRSLNELSGAPESVIDRALARAEHLDRKRKYAELFHVG